LLQGLSSFGIVHQGADCFNGFASSLLVIVLIVLLAADVQTIHHHQHAHGLNPIPFTRCVQGQPGALLDDLLASFLRQGPSLSEGALRKGKVALPAAQRRQKHSRPPFSPQCEA
jgi:hypothetical protein